MHVILVIPYSREYKYPYFYSKSVHFCRSSSMGTSIHGVLYNETEMTARNIHFLIIIMFIN